MLNSLNPLCVVKNRVFFWPIMSIIHPNDSKRIHQAILSSLKNILLNTLVIYYIVTFRKKKTLDLTFYTHSFDPELLAYLTNVVKIVLPLWIVNKMGFLMVYNF